MTYTDLMIIGGGPAGLSAAKTVSDYGVKSILVEKDRKLGGQLVKQTHRFFGSKKEKAGMRGFTIAQNIENEIRKSGSSEIWTDSTVLGLYEDGVVTVLRNGRMEKIKPKKIIAATGAFERYLAFENNDLPGVFGAGAVQTLMNVFGVLPGKKVLMVGSGNIGLIVSYQLIQAGAKVVQLVEAAPEIGGYLVHASKIARLGVPILTSATLKGVYGNGKVEKAVIHRVDERFNPIDGTEEEIEVDTVCLAVGLTPLNELVRMAGCAMVYSGELGGYVPLRDDFMQTSVNGLYCCGDASGIEEATAAMLSGSIAALHACYSIFPDIQDYQEQMQRLQSALTELRAGPFGEKIRKGLSRAVVIKNA